MTSELEKKKSYTYIIGNLLKRWKEHIDKNKNRRPILYRKKYHMNHHFREIKIWKKTYYLSEQPKTILGVIILFSHLDSIAYAILSYSKKLDYCEDRNYTFLLIVWLGDDSIFTGLFLSSFHFYSSRLYIGKQNLTLSSIYVHKSIIRLDSRCKGELHKSNVYTGEGTCGRARSRKKLLHPRFWTYIPITALSFRCRNSIRREPAP